MKPAISRRLNRLELIDPSADALVVGDANLTFSILLAKHREATGCEEMSKGPNFVIFKIFKTKMMLKQQHVFLEIW